MAVAQKIAITWIELTLLILTVVAGMGIWVFVKQRVELSEKVNEPLEATSQRDAELLLKQAKHSSLQNELTTVQTKLAQEQIEVRRKEYWLENLAKSQPKSSSPTQSVPATTPNAEVEKTRNELAASKRLIEDLTREAENKRTDSIHSLIEVEAAKLRASAQFAKAQFRFQGHKRLETFCYGATAIGGFLVLVWIVVSIIGGVGRFATSRTLVVGGSAMLLAILIGYETFEFAGAGVAGILAVIVILSLMPSRRNAQES